MHPAVFQKLRQYHTSFNAHARHVMTHRQPTKDEAIAIIIVLAANDNRINYYKKWHKKKNDAEAVLITQNPKGNTK